jgi:hypothetical protein
MRRVVEAAAIVAGSFGLLAGCPAQLPNGTVTSVHCEPKQTATGNCPDPTPPNGSWRVCVKADKVSDIKPEIDAGNGVACGKGWIGEGSSTNNVNSPAARNCQVGEHYPQCEDPRRK